MTKEDYVHYRLDRAYEAFEDAKLLGGYATMQGNSLIYRGGLMNLFFRRADYIIFVHE